MFLSFYKKLFSVQEIENSKILPLLHYIVLFSCFLSFRKWIYLPHVSTHLRDLGQHVCPPYFLKCGDLFFLTARPFGYSLLFAYAVLFLVILLSVIYCFRKKYVWAHILVWPLFLWKILMMFVLSYNFPMDFEYFSLPLLFLYLTVPHKLYFISRIMPVLYFVAAIIKFDEGWISGTYFTTLKLGMPLVSDFFTPLLSNFVIISEIFLGWFLLSSESKIRMSVLYFWIAFHIYSVILVGYHYPSYCVLILLVLYSFKDSFIRKPERGSFQSYLWGYSILSALILAAVINFVFYPKDKYFMATHKLTVGMFYSNSQCESHSVTYYQNGRKDKKSYFIQDAMKRCIPYKTFFLLKNKCREDVERISWKYYKSLNGRAFYELVNTENICSLSYNFLTENKWLRQGKTVGFPAKNFTNSKKVVRTSIIYPEEQVRLSSFQEEILKWFPFIRGSYVFLWFFVLFFVIRKEILGFRNR